MPTIHLLIKGKVQGVFYRASAKAIAEKWHITGWIKNTTEGHVETLASGKEADLAQFVQWCRKGPERAEVSDVIELPKLSGEPASTHYNGFVIVR